MNLMQSIAIGVGGITRRLCNYGMEAQPRLAASAQMRPLASPMQHYIDAVYYQTQRSGQTFSLDAVMNYACAQLGPTMNSEKMARFVGNLRGCDLRGMVINQSGIDVWRANCPEASDMQLDLRDTILNDCVFHPASTVNCVIINEVDINCGCDMQRLHFEGFNKEPALLELGESSMPYAEVKGSGNSQAAYIAFEFCGTNAPALDISCSRFTEISAQPGPTRPANLMGLDAEQARALKLNTIGCELSGANLSGASLAPESSIRNCNMIGADLSGLIAREVDMRGTNAAGCNLQGTDITSWQMEGFACGADDLHGALCDGKVIGEDISPQDVMTSKGITELSSHAVREMTSAAEQCLSQLEKGQHVSPHHCAGSDMAAIAQNHCRIEDIPLVETDKLIRQCLIATRKLAQGNLQQTLSDLQHSGDLLGDDGINMKGEELATHRFRVEHETFLGRNSQQA